MLMNLPEHVLSDRQLVVKWSVELERKLDGLSARTQFNSCLHLVRHSGTSDELSMISNRFFNEAFIGKGSGFSVGLGLGRMSRWKGKGAKKVAEAKPLSGLYEEIRSWEEPLQCTLDVCGGLVKVNSERMRALSAACFGSPTVRVVSENPDGNVHVLNLTLEEAFYLGYEFRCLYFCHQSSEGPVQLTLDETWCWMKDKQKRFVMSYKAYSHLRAKRWVVRPGPQYGADFMAYRHHPCLVHSDYAVLVMPEDDEARMGSWTDVQAMTRLCGSVAKTLLLLYIRSGSGGEFNCPGSLDNLSVEEVEVKRWLPEKHREDQPGPGLKQIKVSH